MTFPKRVHLCAPLRHSPIHSEQLQPLLLANELKIKMLVHNKGLHGPVLISILPHSQEGEHRGGGTCRFV